MTPLKEKKKRTQRERKIFCKKLWENFYGETINRKKNKKVRRGRKSSANFFHRFAGMGKLGQDRNCFFIVLFFSLLYFHAFVFFLPYLRVVAYHVFLSGYGGITVENQHGLFIALMNSISVYIYTYLYICDAVFLSTIFFWIKRATNQ